MLELLRIRNLAIVEEIEISFSSGLNIITGETGAGKSIILKAIDLLSGKRTSADIIRASASQCFIEGIFCISEQIKNQIKNIDPELITDETEDELIVKRAIEQSGKSKLYVNGNLVTQQQMQILSSILLDITSQHQQTTLLNPTSHLSILDSYGVPQTLNAEAAAAFLAFSKAEKELQRFQNSQEERLRYYDIIKAEHKELSEANLKHGEREKIELEIKKFSCFESLTASLAQCLTLLQGDDSQSEGIESKLRTLMSTLKRCCTLDLQLQEPYTLLDSARLSIKESEMFIENYLSQLQSDPQKIESLRDRLNEIAKLERKYRHQESELLNYFQKIDLEIKDFDSGRFNEQMLKEAKAEAEIILRKLEIKLTEARKTAAKKLVKLVEQGLKQLGMKHARFQVDIVKKQSSLTGCDDVQFLLAANPGQGFQPLAKVASGGELSRILLVLKTALNSKTNPSLQIFDEIDSGISSHIAQTVGEKLKQLSMNNQIIIVTHSPQIASFAESHFVITKQCTPTKTIAQIQKLDSEKCISQIAKMLAGKEVSSEFEESARKLILEASTNSKNSSSLTTLSL